MMQMDQIEIWIADLDPQIGTVSKTIFVLITRLKIYKITRVNALNFISLNKNGL